MQYTLLSHRGSSPPIQTWSSCCFQEKMLSYLLAFFSSIIVASMDRSMLSMHVHVYACPHPLDICLHYQNLELPWRPKTTKEYTKTAKKIVLNNMRQE